jgi:dUTP pyrophosphatase
MKAAKVLIRREASATDLPLPTYMTAGASGMDLCAAVTEDISIAVGSTELIPTGFSVAIPEGYEAQIRPRSGLALKHGITFLNSPGTIDSDYRGEIKLITTNFGKEPFIVKRGMRMAQMVISEVVKVVLEEVKSLDDTARASGGFGHTGVHH